MGTADNLTVSFITVIFTVMKVKSYLKNFMKKYYEQANIGRAKYVVNFHDGKQKHNDGSEFYDIRIFKNKIVKNQFIQSLKDQGYIYNYKF